MYTLVIFQKDLRLHDNPALYYAAQQNRPIICVYVPDNLGGANFWWGLKSFESFKKSLSEHGIPLIYCNKKIDDLVKDMRSIVEVVEICWNDSGTNWLEAIPDGKVFPPNLLFSTIEREFKVFTPFWRYCLGQETSVPFPFPQFTAIHRNNFTFPHEFIPEKPTPKWWGKMDQFWQPGEVGARLRWRRFLRDALSDYKPKRDIPSEAGTSMLSPHLHFGEIGIREMWQDLTNIAGSSSLECFKSELGWREFAHHNLRFYPKMSAEPIRQQYADFPWLHDEKLLKAWQSGNTGYPLIDAGMRQLWDLGWMHNRVRMIVGSLLTKNLLIRWQDGADWFLDTLVDADIANNSLGWQWVSGCGVDAAPYFRIFNPILQSKKFDPNGDYIRKWVPELARVPDKYIHEPWTSPDFKSIRYCEPVVDIVSSRSRALNAYSSMIGKAPAE